MIIWQFLGHGTPKLDTYDDIENTVTMHSEETLQRIAPDKEPKQFKRLGIRTPENLDDTYEYAATLTKIKSFSKFLIACPLQKEEA